MHRKLKHGTGRTGSGPCAAWGWVASACFAVSAAGSDLASEGVEYALSRGLAADQTRPSISLSSSGGYAAWEDNGVDGNGLGIGAVKLNASLSPISTRMFRVNQMGSGEQERPWVQALDDGGAVFVWQGGAQGSQDIWVRRLGATGVFTIGDVRVNSHTTGQQQDPQAASLSDGSLVVVWSSEAQDGSMQGIYAQRVALDGSRIGPEFRVNQFTAYNQRSPAIATLEDGSFVVGWVTENQRFQNSVDVYARRFTGTGVAAGDEFRLNNSGNVCANPAMAPGWAGGFVAAWSERDASLVTNMWDVTVGAFTADGASPAFITRANTHTPHNQFEPRVVAAGGSRVVVWNSLWQDGSRDGVYARVVTPSGPTGTEAQVNTLTASRQMQPAVAADDAGRVLVAWSGFVGGEASFEVLGQRFSGAQPIPTPTPPMVSALDSYSLMVSWEPLAGYPSLAGYRLFIDGSSAPVGVSGTFQVLNDLDPGTVHSVRLAYALEDGSVSSLSAPASGTTWGRDRNHDGLPDDWQTTWWGATASDWPVPGADSDGDGASNLAEFLAGTSPTQAASSLKMGIRPTVGGFLVEWNAVPGSVYQLQSSGNLRNWDDAAGPAYAAEELAHSLIPGTNPTAYYRVVRIR